MESARRPTDAAQRRRGRRRALAAAGVVLGLFVAHGPLLRSVARAIAADTTPPSADFILPLYHEPQAVAPAAAQLLRSGHAPRIALYEARPTRMEIIGVIPKRHETWRDLLHTSGVPRDRIDLFGRSVTSYRQILEEILASTTTRPIRLTAVATRPLSRIAAIDLRRAAEGLPVQVHVHATASAAVDERIWWRSSAGLVTYFDAYTLWLLRMAR